MNTLGLKRPALALIILLLQCACASTQTSNQTAIDQGDYLSRAQSQTEDEVTVVASVPSKDEAQALFGAPLYSRGVQPVWLEITNNRDTAISFLPVGLDPQYFSPIEAANLDLKLGSSGKLSPTIDPKFFGQSMRTTIPPGETESGFVFSALDEGTKAFNVDIVSDDLLITFTFFIQVPGLHVDHYNVDWKNLYRPGEIRDLNDEQMIEYLEAQTCCTSDKKGSGSGDPVNLVVIGNHEDVYAAFIRADWDETETVTGGTALKTIKSFLAGSEYRYSPVSGLYVYERPQDVAFQKARSNIHERNHLRLWMAPVTLDGVPVWLGQISRDIGVRFTTKTITTHKIDPDVDETREFLLEDLAYSQALLQFGYVEGAIPAPINAPRGNLTGDPYFTDGYRVVLWVTSQPVDIGDIEFVEWRRPENL